MSGGIHGHVAQRAERAPAGDGLRAARGHGAHLRPRRVQAGHVALVVVFVDVVIVVVFFAERLADRRVALVVGGPLAQLDEHELTLGIEAETDEAGAEQRNRRLA